MGDCRRPVAGYTLCPRAKAALWRRGNTGRRSRHAEVERREGHVGRILFGGHHPKVTPPMHVSPRAWCMSDGRVSHSTAKASSLAGIGGGQIGADGKWS